MPTTPPIELFFSYSHKDEELRNELEKHLTMLRREGVIAGWHDRRISAGSEWAGDIDRHVDGAGIILLLVSADFVSSEYCYDIEMKRALERQRANDVRVIPIILRAVDWTGAPFSAFQALPTGGRAVTSWPNRDEAFTDVAQGIRKAAAELRSAKSTRPGRSDYFAAQQQLIEDHLREFVGRADVDRDLDTFLEKSSRGYFIASGGPGQGKTALSAHLAKTRGLAHHFIHRSGGRSDVRLILCSLIAQLQPDLEGPSPSAALPELAKAFDEALGRAAAKHRRLVIVIDALDELMAPPGEESLFLPVETLADGVYVVVTSRPHDRLTALQGRLFATPSKVFALQPLDAAESRAIMHRAAAELPPGDVERLVRASAGSPLYIQTALAAMQAGRAFDMSNLPPALDDYYDLATRRLPPSLHDLLGVLAVTRRSLSVGDLADIIGQTERETSSSGVELVREFLNESEGAFTLYHEHFRDFVTREYLYDSELRSCHRRIAAWLETPTRRTREYRLTSLAFHLYESGDLTRLSQIIDSAFLADKVRRCGYAVLEDVEYLTRALLEADDPTLVERCVNIVNGLRTVVGSDIIADATSAMQFGGSSVRRRQQVIVTPHVRSIPRIDLYAGFLPKGMITADFVEVVPQSPHLFIAIGDAPSSGIKSAFVARFIANLFNSRVKASENPRPADLLGQVRRRIVGHAYFEWLSMQCVDIDIATGRLSVANAGHPFPALYNARRRQWDQLPARGELLHAGELGSYDTPYQERHFEIAPGDVLVLVSDGLTEGSARFHDPFGYRFTDLIGPPTGQSARQIGEAILDAWLQHPRAEDWADDVSVVVAVIDPSGPAMRRVD